MHLTKVQVLGHYLKTMARSAAIETHFQSISNILIVDTNKSWMPDLEFEEVEDTYFVDFQHFKPFSIQKGKTILPWESYRDWLMLMIHYFNAAEVLGDFALKLKIKPDAAISITILTPPLSNKWMLPWTKLLENKSLFPVLPVVSSGRELIEFLNNPVEPLSNLTFFYQELKEGGCLSASGRGFTGTYLVKPILPPSLPPRRVMSRISRRVWICQI